MLNHPFRGAVRPFVRERRARLRFAVQQVVTAFTMLLSKIADPRRLFCRESRGAVRNRSLAQLRRAVRLGRAANGTEG